MEWKKDTSGELERYFNKLIGKHFKILSYVDILYAWGDEKIKGDSVTYGETIKLTTLNRDLFGYDFVIVIYKSSWDNLTEHEKYKLAYHELCHCYVESQALINQEKGEVDYIPKYDKKDRPKIKIRDHDIKLERFSSELKKFGLSQSEIELMKFLNRVYKKVNLRRRKNKEENE